MTSRKQAVKFPCVCKWCKSPFLAYFKNQQFCDTTHSVSYQRQVHSIYKRFPFGKESDSELVKLQKKGMSYVLPLRQSDIELNERFSIWLEHKEQKKPLTATSEKVNN